MSKMTEGGEPVIDRRRRTRGAETRDTILSAAIRRIAHLGFEGLRVRDVAMEAGINNATLHHHFPTKEDLIAGVVERFVSEFEAAQPERLASDLDRRFEQYRTSVRELMAAKPAMFVILNELLLRAARDPVIAKLMAPSQERWLDYLLYLLSATSMSDVEKRETAERCRHELLGESLARGAGGRLAPEA